MHKLAEEPIVLQCFKILNTISHLIKCVGDTQGRLRTKTEKEVG